MAFSLLAAAGLAEASWAFAMMVMQAGILVFGGVAVLAAVMASRKIALAALVLCVLFTLLFQPWNCFTPFEPIDYDDPDVVSAAASFHAVGVFWIGGSVLTVICTVIAWLRAPIPESS